MLRITVGGSSAYPPTIGHKAFLETILNSHLFDIVYWIVSGTRTDKDYDIDPRHRCQMTELLTHHLSYDRNNVRLVVIKENLNQPNTPSIVWLETISAKHPEDIVTLYTGSDSLYEIGEKWVRGLELTSGYPIIVLTRKGFPLPPTNEPVYQNFKHLTVW